MAAIDCKIEYENLRQQVVEALGDEMPKTVGVNFLYDFAERIRKEESERAWLAPCKGCSEGHSSFWRTVVISPQWKAWEGVAHEQGWDWGECTQCGWISDRHFQAFLTFAASLIEINKGDVK